MKISDDRVADPTSTQAAGKYPTTWKGLDSSAFANGIWHTQSKNDENQAVDYDGPLPAGTKKYYLPEIDVAKARIMAEVLMHGVVVPNSSGCAPPVSF